MNFWGYIIEGITSVLVSTLGQLPIGLTNPILANFATMAYFGIAPVLFFVGPFINFSFFNLVVGSILGLEGVRLLYAAWRGLLKLIPAAG